MAVEQDLGPSRRELRMPNVLRAIFVAFAIGTVAYAMRTGFPLRYLDEREYLQIAQNVYSGKGYSLNGNLTAYRPPAWPLFITLVSIIGVGGKLLLIVPAVLMTSAAIAAGWISSRISGSAWGWVAAPLMLAYPLNLYVSSTLYPQAIATAGISALWVLCVRLENTREFGVRASVGCGLLAALVVLSVPTMIFTVLVAGLWIAWRVPRSIRIRSCTIGAVSFAAPLAAWTVRNFVSLGSPVVLSTSSGENLLYGNNPNAKPGSGTNVDISELRSRSESMSAMERDDFFRTQAFDWIKENPLDATELYLGKVLNYFSGYNEPASGSFSILAFAVGWTSMLILLLAIGLRLTLRRYMPISAIEALLLFTFFSNAFFMAIFFTRTRFRQPLDTILIIEATVAAVCAFSAWLAYRRSATRGGQTTQRWAPLPRRR